MNIIRALRKLLTPTPWMSAIPTIFRVLLDLCRGRLEIVRKEIWGHGATNEETLQQMKTFGTATATSPTRTPLSACSPGKPTAKQHPEPAQGLVLATAHPAKFAEIVQKGIGIAPPLPSRLAEYLNRPKLSLAHVQQLRRFQAIPAKPLKFCSGRRLRRAPCMFKSIFSGMNFAYELRRSRSISMNNTVPSTAFTAAATTKCILNNCSGCASNIRRTNTRMA